jgi:hypothetical protein
MDFHSGFSTNSPQMLAMEEILSRQSDLVLVTSRLLLNEKVRQNPSCILVPNAADVNHFLKPANKPMELQTISRPIIGYYGAIADWFDTALIRSLALARPAWSFVLIGSTLFADLKFDGLANVHWLVRNLSPYRYCTFDGYIPKKPHSPIPIRKVVRICDDPWLPLT